MHEDETALSVEGTRPLEDDHSVLEREPERFFRLTAREAEFAGMTKKQRIRYIDELLGERCGRQFRMLWVAVASLAVLAGVQLAFEVAVIA